MANVNERIVKEGTIVLATKNPVVTIGIGPISKLADLKGTIWHDGNNVVIATKEDPQGCIYEQNRIAVVRIIGGKVRINGLYDIYAPSNDKIEKLLGDTIEVGSLPVDQIYQLEPILNVASEIRPSVSPAEYGRKVIIITDKMVGERGYIECHCPWDPDDVLTKLYEGDVFLVEDEETFKGYRIGKEEFEGTHQLED